MTRYGPFGKSLSSSFKLVGKFRIKGNHATIPLISNRSLVDFPLSLNSVNVVNRYSSYQTANELKAKALSQMNEQEIFNMLHKMAPEEQSRFLSDLFQEDDHPPYKPKLEPNAILSKSFNYDSHNTSSLIELSDEQEKVIDLIMQGHSVFFTGSAGTGKSILLKTLIQRLLRKYPSYDNVEQVAVCAATGLAALNINGMTLHRFAGIGLGHHDVESLLKRVKANYEAKMRWQSIRVLIIDEISMIDGELFDKIAEIASRIRGKDPKGNPWGGIQLVCCGDFFQLPSVPKPESLDSDVTFCFESKSWKQKIKHHIVLEKVFRQKGDAEFIDMLNEVRFGNVSQETTKKFMELSRPLASDDIEPAQIYSTRNEVDTANNTRLEELEGEEHVFTAVDGGTLNPETDKDRIKALMKGITAPRTLTLKTGAKVMMLKNMDDTLVNGSLGKVVDFIDQETYAVYCSLMTLPRHHHLGFIKKKIKENRRSREYIGLPQIRYTEEDLFDNLAFDYLLGHLSLSPRYFGDSKRAVQVKRLLKKLTITSGNRRFPLVKFDGLDRGCVLVEPESWQVEGKEDKPLVSRTQLPLLLAWAISIHKSQGQTLYKVKVDLKGVFENGQAYVALSRAVNREGLQVLNFDPAKVKANDKVVQFYSKLSNAGTVKS
ncbi:hypothetical protein WICPIJ_009107 [Wickerhamomyces pijperi]|uniref:ATP-dependent DNA helicase n=1 Tax=Wickerhamomyces pijperi TaxID=599730 RepID=A0A9P8PQM9_WICPI|nr:hypothetical protein WICPIJ_009107 [Wickerhamomyces pijperi]